MTSTEERLRAEVMRLNQYNQRLTDALAQARAFLAEAAGGQRLPQGHFGTLVDTAGDGTMTVVADGRMLRLAPAVGTVDQPPGRGETVLLDNAYGVLGGVGRAVTGKLVMLVSLLSNGHRAMVTEQGRHSVVRLADALLTTALRPGDHLLVDQDAGYALEVVPGSLVEQLLEAMPVMDAGLIGALQPQIRVLRDAFATGVSSVLLHGPTGCGKTMLAQAMATEIGGHRLRMRLPELMSKYIGEAEERLGLLADRITALADEGLPVVLHISDLDALLRVRTETPSLVGRFVGVLDRFAAHHRMVVIAETNRRDLIDPAALRPDRFPLQLHIGPPDRAGAEDILARLLLPGEPPPRSILDLFDCSSTASGAALAAAVYRAGVTRVSAESRRAVDRTGQDQTQTLGH